MFIMEPVTLDIVGSIGREVKLKVEVEPLVMSGETQPSFEITVRELLKLTHTFPRLFQSMHRSFVLMEYIPPM